MIHAKVSKWRIDTGTGSKERGIMRKEQVRTIDDLMAYALERDTARLAALEANRVYLKALPGVDWRLIREHRERERQK